jgi:hypothetical protein
MENWLLAQSVRLVTESLSKEGVSPLLKGGLEVTRLGINAVLGRPCP